MIKNTRLLHTMYTNTTIVYTADINDRCTALISHRFPYLSAFLALTKASSGRCTFAHSSFIGDQKYAVAAQKSIPKLPISTSHLTEINDKRCTVAHSSLIDFPTRQLLHTYNLRFRPVHIRALVLYR